MGEDTIEPTKQMFKVRINFSILNGISSYHHQDEVPEKISLSLNAWTSSNNYAFLAIVAHYVNKEGKLGNK